ncbi:hypothetical protein ACE01N_16090 [Saccharicrinis sp. FJH2]|uniref:hypothetical protein n=1 Tax=Saccharicrinis sp. FJH65 TaxID=3344659 RepID=UPI0035F34815
MAKRLKRNTTVVKLSKRKINKIEREFTRKIEETRDAYLEVELQKYQNIRVIYD